MDANPSGGFNVLFLALSFLLVFTTADEWITILAETRPVIGSFLLKCVLFFFSLSSGAFSEVIMDRWRFFLLCCF